MNVYCRNLSGPDDPQQMHQLAAQEWGSTLHVIDLPYRLSSWALDDPENVALWFDGEKLIGWAVMQIPFWSVDLVISNEAKPDILQAVLEWADQRAKTLLKMGKGLPSWFIYAFSGQTAVVDRIEANGFADQTTAGADSWSKVWMKRRAAQPFKRYEARGGCRVRPLSGAQEAPAYVELHQTVFQSRNMQLEWRLRTLEHPGYRNEFDIVIESPQGQLAAFCIGWMQEGVDGVLRGQIEPLGCRAEYRHLGLGRVALAQVIERLQDAGVEEIWVETDRYRNTALSLYEHMGFAVVKDVMVFRKDYE